LAAAAVGGAALAQDTTAPAAPPATDAPAAAAPSDPALAGLPAEDQGANLKNGRQQWVLCAACPMIADGTKPSVGPDLHGIFGKTAGTNPSFTMYTPALKASGIVWSPETLDKWVTDPRAMIPTTAMIFPGLKKPEQRRDLIAYLWEETNK